MRKRNQHTSSRQLKNTRSPRTVWKWAFYLLIYSGKRAHYWTAGCGQRCRGLCSACVQHEHKAIVWCRSDQVSGKQEQSRERIQGSAAHRSVLLSRDPARPDPVTPGVSRGGSRQEGFHSAVLGWCTSPPGCGKSQKGFLTSPSEPDASHEARL